MRQTPLVTSFSQKAALVKPLCIYFIFVLFVDDSWINRILWGFLQEHVHGHLHGGNGGESGRPRFCSSSLHLPARPLELAGFRSRCIIVSTLSSGTLLCMIDHKHALLGARIVGGSAGIILWSFNLEMSGI